MKKLTPFIVTILFLFPNVLKAQIITTAAGTGTVGYTGDGGPATAAKVKWPYAINFDTAGNVYFADIAASVVRKINIATGVITTIAGTGTPGYNGPRIDATTAMLYQPNSVAIDRKGNVYISDGGNNRVRKVFPSGQINNYVGNGTPGFSGDGGAAISAELYTPDGLAFDTAGNLLICDVHSSNIRKVSAVDSTITTIAGTGGVNGYSGDGGLATAAKLYHPEGLAVDRLGNIYIADRDNHVVRKISTTGIITTVAGNGSGIYSGDDKPATAAGLTVSEVAVDTGLNIYIPDFDNNRLRMVSPNDTITTIAGNGTGADAGDGGNAATAELHQPFSVGVDKWGDIYIGNGFATLREIINCQTLITKQPVDFSGSSGGSAVFSITGRGASSYQWQVDTGTGFYNLTAGTPYSGVTTNTLSISSTRDKMNNYKYRCITTKIAACDDTSTSAKLLLTLDVRNMTLNNAASIVPNPANDFIMITAVDKIDDLQIINITGRVLIEQHASATKMTLDIHALQQGFYFVKINGIMAGRLVKQ